MILAVLFSGYLGRHCHANFVTRAEPLTAVAQQLLRVPPHLGVRSRALADLSCAPSQTTEAWIHGIAFEERSEARIRARSLTIGSPITHARIVRTRSDHVRVHPA